ncbi:MAG: hypothetical protein LAN71_15020 [Acidobacteriia bacterium]|nr:hypothetical protein [Terriglobia bacterium]
MKTSHQKSLRIRSLATMASLCLAALAFTAPSTPAQDIVRGTFTLPVEARLGKTILPAGDYKFTVESLGLTHSVASIQSSRSPVLVVISGMVKGERIASVMALASKSALLPNPHAPDIQADASGMTLHSMSLDKLDLVIEFYGDGAKGPLHAHGPELPRGAIAAKAGA